MEIDTERQQQARAYARIRLRISLISLCVSVVVVCLILAIGLEKWLRDLLQSTATSLPLLDWQPHPGWYPLQILAYFLVIFIAYELLTFPVGYYSGFVLPHRYGISIMSLKAWFADVGKSFLLNVVLQAGLVSLVYALLAFQPQTWWLWVAATLLLFSVVLANLAPIILYPLYYKFTLLPEGELTERLLALTGRARTRVRGVYSMQMSNKTTATNAALMGLGNTRRIVLGDTMIDRYSTDEIEVVLAHELGHHVHRDIWRLIISQTVLTLAGLFLASLLLHWIIDTQHYYLSLTDPATMPFFLLFTAAFGLIIMPLGNAISRAIEYQADEYALQATQKITAFKTAMTRLANQNLSEIEPSPLVELLFHSHPSIAKRLKHADEFAARGNYAFKASINADN